MKYDIEQENTCTISRGLYQVNTARKAAFLKNCLSSWASYTSSSYYLGVKNQISKGNTHPFHAWFLHENIRFWIALLRSLHSTAPFPAYIAPWTGDRCAVPLH